jgi:hypothetical protein
MIAILSLMLDETQDIKLHQDVSEVQELMSNAKKA